MVLRSILGGWFLVGFLLGCKEEQRAVEDPGANRDSQVVLADIFYADLVEFDGAPAHDVTQEHGGSSGEAIQVDDRGSSAEEIAVSQDQVGDGAETSVVAPCGDGECDRTIGETCTTCQKDCGICPVCGDGKCEKNQEDCGACPIDCGACPEVCGNGECHGDETCSSCPQDCGPCIPKCPDGYCSGDETCVSCPVDCGTCPPYCGDGSCNGVESCISCPQDCGQCPDTCGDGVCLEGHEDCQSCPDDCGGCPPTLWFRSDWQEKLDGPIVAGKKLRIKYDWDRLKQCRQHDENGFPAWMITVFYTDDLSKPAKGVQVVWHDAQGKSWPVEPVIDIPGAASNLWFWANNTGPGNCLAWDSDYGKNYMMPVFTEDELKKPIGWMGWGSGGLDFAFVNEGGPISKGDVDPVWFFLEYLGGEITTAVRVQVYVAGVTDRIYQNQAVAGEVAHTAVVTFVETDFAQNAGYPGAPFVLVPLEFEYQANNNFYYRWYFGSYGYVWYIANGPPPPGLYSFRLGSKMAMGETWWVGKPSEPSSPRKLIYAETADQACLTYFDKLPPEVCL